ncbi:ferredoxin [Globicatella sp. PHS-GS-PNBC-21-1553]|uniref:ferredoxin n=1 Tax=Globicatella sp. PHS-GS-PNBC-21-1553 TaxID=2885764 RepID=UPI00298EF12D|nr:ferredoxin [Globicatella sp. PHS-GS-PNBC-21-1553]
MTQLYVIPEKCIACGKCFLNFPEVFDCNDEGIAFVKKKAHLSNKPKVSAPFTIVLQRPLNGYLRRINR